MAAKKPGVSRILDANPKSRVLTDLAIPPVVLNRQTRRAIGSVIRKQIRVHLMLDKSGSFCRHEETLKLLVAWFIEQVMKVPGLPERLILCVTELSGIVKSSGYMPVGEFVPANIPAQGMSPFATALLHMIEQNESLADDREGALQIDIPIGDWFASGEEISLVEAIAKYRAHQAEFCGGTHVFPVSLGDNVNPIVDTVSVKHVPYANKDEAFEEIFALILDLIKDVSQDEGSLQDMKSLSPEELQGKAG